MIIKGTVKYGLLLEKVVNVMREKIIESIKNVKGNNFGYTENLVTDGWLSSFDLLFIIHELEEEFKISIPPEKITPEDFDSLAHIENLVKELK